MSARDSFSKGELERLTVAVEKQVLLDALERDPGLVNNRRAHDMLDRVLDAWRQWSSTKGFIRRMFKLGVELPNIDARKEQGYEERESSDFDHDYLEWFDGLIMSLTPEQKDLIRREVFYRNDRRRAERWAKQWGCSQRTYYNRLKQTRQQLVIAMLNRW